MSSKYSYEIKAGKLHPPIIQAIKAAANPWMNQGGDEAAVVARISNQQDT